MATKPSTVVSIQSDVVFHYYDQIPPIKTISQNIVREEFLPDELTKTNTQINMIKYRIRAKSNDSFFNDPLSDVNHISTKEIKVIGTSKLAETNASILFYENLIIKMFESNKKDTQLMDYIIQLIQSKDQYDIHDTQHECLSLIKTHIRNINVFSKSTLSFKQGIALKIGHMNRLKKMRNLLIIKLI